MNEKVVVYAGSRNIYPDMVTAANSLLTHNKVDKIYFLIEDDIFPFKIPSVIETINVSNQTWFLDGGPNMKTRFTYIVLLRAALALLFPQYDRVLSLDVDTIVTGDISGIWDIDISNYYFAACTEPLSAKGAKWPKTARFYEKQDVYYNVGVTMYNLKMLRETGMAEKNIEMLNSEWFYSVEQDTFNITCGGKILEIPSDYNVNDIWTKPTDNPLIIHYAGVPLKKWRREPLVAEYWTDEIRTVMEKKFKVEDERERNPKIVVYAGTKNLYQDMVNAVKSLLYHTRVDKVYFLIEDNIFPYKLPEVVETMNVKNQKWFPPFCANCQQPLTYMVLMRAVYTKLFPQYDKVLQIDVDTIVEDDISDLWNLNLTNYYFAACIEPMCSIKTNGRWKKRYEYFNMGVALLNLKKLRDDRKDNVIINKIQAGRTEAQEQGVFNAVCDGHILEIPPEYNSSDWTEIVDNPKVRHFAGDRQWQKNYKEYIDKYRDISFEEIMERDIWQDT